MPLLDGNCSQSPPWVTFLERENMSLKNKRNRPVNQNRFAHIPHTDMPRSNFKRSHVVKTAFDSGYIVPILAEEVLPGDTWNAKLSSVARLSTPVVPFMDNIHLDFFFFYVPNRLLWTNWVKMMGEQTDPGDSISYTVPEVTCPGGGVAEESLYDYLGIPPGTQYDFNALHSRAYNLIWNEWFRCEYLQDSAVVDVDDGPDTDTDYVLLKRGKRHDYFSSALPWPEKDANAVDLPLGTEAPVIGNGDVTSWEDSLTPSASNRFGMHTLGTSANLQWSGAHSGTAVGSTTTPATYPGASNVGVGLSVSKSRSGMIADLSDATAATINSLREAFQLQRMLERDARGGTRYTELLWSHFRVESPDHRLQRPEYLGGGSTMIEVTPIANTSDTATTNQGDLAAVGYAAQSGIGFTKSFVEHGVILGLVNCRADLNYSQGLSRMWTRQTKHDFYWPALAHLGEQELYGREISLEGANPDDVWGYQERWAEYRYGNSLISGKMRSDATGSLDVWHLALDFGGTRPSLNASFIEDSPPISRVVAVSSEPEIIFDGFWSIVTTRSMPVYSVPGLIDHF